jgi:hypothetical protein
LLCVAGLLALALAPAPALSAERTKLTLLEALTNAAMLDRPLPELSTPAALSDANAMSSICTAPATLLTTSAGAPAVAALDVTVALPPT